MTVRSATAEPVEDVGLVVAMPSEARLPAWLTPITAVVAGQLVAWRAAELRGVDVDNPGELSKITLTH